MANELNAGSETWLDNLIYKLRSWTTKQNILLVLLGVGFAISMALGIYSLNYSKQAQYNVIESQFSQRLTDAETLAKAANEKVIELEKDKREQAEVIKGLQSAQSQNGLNADKRIKYLEDANSEFNNQLFRVNERLGNLEVRDIRAR